jgi:TM2 domain-containing membrane protein YozV
MNLQKLDERSLLIYLNQQKSPGTCAAVEVAGTLFGVSGIGHVMAGRLIGGLFLTLCYWALLSYVFCGGATMLGSWALYLIPLWWVLTGISAAQSARATNRALVAQLLTQQAAGDR